MNVRMPYLVTLLLPILCFPLLTTASQEANAQTDAKKSNAIEWRDLTGRAYTTSDIQRSKATVFFFTSTRCPVSNLYVPRMIDLARDYQARGVQFFMINCNPADTADVVTKYAADYGLTFPAVKDEELKLVDRLGARMTPETIIVDPTGATRYRGRIDDNRVRASVTRQEVRAALEAILSGRQVERPYVPAFGCTIFREKSGVKAGDTKINVTYSRDIAPILSQHCVACHRTGEAAPFSLTSYEQAKIWAAPIKDYTRRHIMPPWKVSPEQSEKFDGGRRLTDAEIKTLSDWADADAPQGDEGQGEPAANRHLPDAWRLGSPDVIVKPSGTYHISADGQDEYRCFAMPIDFKEERFISGLEFKPGNRAIIHHMICLVDPTGEISKMDGQEAEPGFPMRFEPLLQTAIWADSWNPGSEPRLLPEGVAMRVPAGGRLILQIHYVRTGKVETDDSRLGVYWAKGEVKKVAAMLCVGPENFTLKAGDAHIELKGSYVLPDDAEVLSIFPHMHGLGREMAVTAAAPGNSAKPLISVADFDANWQITYTYKQPVALPRGTKISLAAIFDNSAESPGQSNQPPKTVKSGLQSTNEMCFAYLMLAFDINSARNR